MAGKINIEFQKALRKQRIVRFDKGVKLVKKELDSASDDLAEAKDRFKNKKYKYATIAAYYSMFHIARALLYSKGFREKSHYYLLVALQALFVEKGLIEEDLAEEFHAAMVLREGADYHGEFSKEGAETCVDSASRFLKKAESIIS